ncbi:MAG: hypothetical protein V3R65_01180 [Acidiferrobacterales bacterium]
MVSNKEQANGKITRNFDVIVSCFFTSGLRPTIGNQNDDWNQYPGRPGGVIPQAMTIKI